MRFKAKSGNSPRNDASLNCGVVKQLQLICLYDRQHINNFGFRSWSSSWLFVFLFLSPKFSTKFFKESVVSSCNKSNSNSDTSFISQTLWVFFFFPAWLSLMILSNLRVFIWLQQQQQMLFTDRNTLSSCYRKKPPRESSPERKETLKNQQERESKKASFLCPLLCVRVSLHL